MCTHTSLSHSVCVCACVRACGWDRVEVPPRCFHRIPPPMVQLALWAGSTRVRYALAVLVSVWAFAVCEARGTYVIRDPRFPRGCDAGGGRGGAEC